MPYEPLKSMSDAELLRGLQKVGEPLVTELAIRGYEVRLDVTHANFGVIRFATDPPIKPTSADQPSDAG